NSLRSVPPEMREAAAIYRFSWWQRFKWVELPYSMMGLVWNSMMSMAGGWFFLMVSEAFTLNGRDYRVPGIGSYMSEAVAKRNLPACVYAIIAMILMIVLLDQLLWRPVVVWAQKFRIEEGGYQEAMSSWFLNLLKKSRLLVRVRDRVQQAHTRMDDRTQEIKLRRLEAMKLEATVSPTADSAAGHTVSR